MKKYECTNCTTRFSEEDYNIYYESAGFSDFDISKRPSAVICLECNCSDMRCLKGDDGNE